jgi:hypothetical protein
MAFWDLPSDFDPAWDQPAADVWKRGFYSALPETMRNLPGGFANQVVQNAAMRGMSPAYGAYMMSGSPAFSHYLNTYTASDPYMGAATPGWADVVGLSRDYGAGTWGTEQELGNLGPLFADGGLDPNLARSMALARMAPTTGASSWAHGIRGQLAARAIANLQDMYSQQQLGSPQGTQFMGGTISPYEQGGFLNWLSQVAPGQFGIPGSVESDKEYVSLPGGGQGGDTI